MHLRQHHFEVSELDRQWARRGDHEVRADLSRLRPASMRAGKGVPDRRRQILGAQPHLGSIRGQAQDLGPAVMQVGGDTGDELTTRPVHERGAVEPERGKVHRSAQLTLTSQRPALRSGVTDTLGSMGKCCTQRETRPEVAPSAGLSEAMRSPSPVSIFWMSSR